MCVCVFYVVSERREHLVPSAANSGVICDHQPIKGTFYILFFFHKSVIFNNLFSSCIRSKTTYYYYEMRRVLNEFGGKVQK